MNRLITFLKNENDLSIARLKQLYRLLSKKTHPDLVKGTQEEFVRLGQEYEEALEILHRQEPAMAGISAGSGEAGMNPREDVLTKLYLYALKFFGSESEAISLSLIEAARRYDTRICALLTQYHEEFVMHFHEWHHDGRVYYTHSIFVSSIKQLAYYYSFGMPRHRKLLGEYLGELKRRAQKLKQNQAWLLQNLAGWLEEEAGKSKIQII